MYSRVEEERLNYIRSGCSDQMDEAMQRRDDAFLVDPDAQAVELGSALTLPSSFIGSHAWASEQVADALAFCREYGKPSLFITIMTIPTGQRSPLSFDLVSQRQTFPSSWPGYFTSTSRSA